jgi:hypothetical protein
MASVSAEGDWTGNSGRLLQFQREDIAWAEICPTLPFSTRGFGDKAVRPGGNQRTKLDEATLDDMKMKILEALDDTRTPIAEREVFDRLERRYERVTKGS